ncbi:hypothetical protein F0P96_01295 [Hymenobacter busanensis]|uniref:Uncharacterized protein n=1 Tax=Hymenobacter busanensis TaxID=2607656 RepID=A0A7L4ZUT5_9BACT|nr:hypothetical protein [Hymenobacter busanensis]KAA9339290.1 hypothetical protein F0P96_01295 [Hymenobacter busanensis]QHJ06948.1 hypothetical protein GUY19_06455 [Hymenobacter busanensis]
MAKESQQELRKRLKEQYKRQELLKEANNPDSILYHQARIELGIALPPVTVQTIGEATSDFLLLEQLYHKVLERLHLEADGANGWNKQEALVAALSPYHRAVYHLYLFEGALGIGDIDKVFAFDSEVERRAVEEQMHEVCNAYALMGCNEMVDLIQEAQQAGTEKQLEAIASEFERLEPQIRATRLQFVKVNSPHFQLA